MNDLDLDHCWSLNEPCPRCGCCDLWRRRCTWCDGEGESPPGELYEEDPLWYDQDDTAPCHHCEGAGGWTFCREGCDANGKHEPKGAMAQRRALR